MPPKQKRTPQSPFQHTDDTLYKINRHDTGHAGSGRVYALLVMYAAVSKPYQIPHDVGFDTIDHFQPPLVVYM